LNSLRTGISTTTSKEVNSYFLLRGNTTDPLKNEKIPVFGFWYKLYKENDWHGFQSKIISKRTAKQPDPEGAVLPYSASWRRTSGGKRLDPDEDPKGRVLNSIDIRQC
jgi:hypothetical protein